MSVPLIVDTDCGSDCEDMAAIKAACVYHRLGVAKLLGISVNSSNTWAAAAADAERKYLGLSQIPIGVLKGVTLDPAGSGSFTQYVYNNFAHDVDVASSCPDAVAMYRQVLAARTSRDVTIVSLGFLTVLSQLMQSPADGISSLTGAQLVAAAVKRLVIEGGAFPSGTDGWNLSHDAPSAAYVVSNMPSTVQIVFHGDKVGNGLNDLAAASMPTADPCRAAYTQWGASTGRGSCWDQLAVHYAVEGPINAWQLSPAGTVTVNSSTGATSFAAGAGNHYYAIRAKPDAYFQARVADVLKADPAATPMLTWAGGEGFAAVALS